MALKLSITTPEGFECPEAYTKIWWATRDQLSNRGTYRYIVYKDQSARNAELAPVRTSPEIQFDYVRGEDIIVQAYNALKQRPEMADAVDFQPQ